MSPTITMSREFTAWIAGRKMKRGKENERKAAERARKLRGRK